jgi:DNA (cytosine-5)-methyltransferase 1
MKCIDLFSGLGGFHLAAKSLGVDCVFACEIDPELRELYERNFGRMPSGDIRGIEMADIPAHDLLCAGFPCQPFSKAGNQLGRNDRERGTVLDSVLRILRSHRPAFFMLENVAHFVRHDEGNTYAKIEKAVSALGYTVAHTQLSPHRFGIPQIRERMFMVGSLHGLEHFQWPAAETDPSDLNLSEILDSHPTDAIRLGENVAHCLAVWQAFIQRFPSDEELPSFPIWSMEFGASYPFEKDSLVRISLGTLRRTRGSFGEELDLKFRSEILERVPSYARAGENAFPIWKQNFIRQNRELYRRHRRWIRPWLPRIRAFSPSLQKLEWNCKGGDRDIWKYVLQFRASGVRVRRPSMSPSLVAMTTTQVPIIGWERRYMTVRECARLQSMDGLRFLPKYTSAMRALGNAVNVKVARLVMARLIGTADLVDVRRPSATNIRVVTSKPLSLWAG